PLQRDRLVFRAPRRLAAGRRIAALAVLDDFGRALEGGDLADAGDVAAVPFDPELEVLVRVETARVDRELGHLAISLCLDLADDLTDPDDHELGGLQGREADLDVDDAVVDVALRGRLAVALDEIGLARRRALEGALPEKVLHEGADVQADLGPERLVVRLEDDPLRSAEQRLLDEQGSAANRNVLPVGGDEIGAFERPRAPA